MKIFFQLTFKKTSTERRDAHDTNLNQAYARIFKRGKNTFIWNRAKQQIHKDPNDCNDRDPRSAKNDKGRLEGVAAFMNEIGLRTSKCIGTVYLI